MSRGRSTAAAVLAALLLAACAAGPAAPEPAASAPAEGDAGGSQTGASAEASGPEPASSPGGPTQEPIVPSPGDPASRPTAALAPSPEGLAADVFAFSAPIVGGGQAEGGEFAGQDLALWFWAPWCPSCNQEAPGVAQMARQFEGQVRVVGVASRDQVPAMEAFVAEHGLEHVTSIADVDGAVWERFGVVGQPTWIFVDGETGAVARHLGLLGDDDLTAIVQTLVAAG